MVERRRVRRAALGAHLGHDALPAPWLARLELVDVIDQLVADALDELSTDPVAGQEIDDQQWHERYPITAP